MQVINGINRGPNWEAGVWCAKGGHLLRAHADPVAHGLLRRAGWWNRTERYSFRWVSGRDLGLVAGMWRSVLWPAVIWCAKPRFFPRRLGIGMVHPVMGMGYSPPFSFWVLIDVFDSSGKGVVVGKLTVSWWRWGSSSADSPHFLPLLVADPGHAQC
jgi:hypothetical protein